MIVYNVDCDGKDSVISREVLAPNDTILPYEVEDREVAYLMVERHLEKELKEVIAKLREVRKLNREGY